MIDFLRDVQFRLLEATVYDTHRFLFSTFELGSRLVGLTGPRGVGKTTLMLQLIKERLDSREQALYVSADHIYFNRTSLFDFIRENHETDGITRFFIDEIHKYPNWSQELKNIHDSFPKISVVFSGSSSLNLIHGAYDLSRRALLFQLPGLSFREYLNFNLGTDYCPVSLDDILNGHELLRQIAGITGLRGHFQNYLAWGYYPFALDEPQYFNRRLENMIGKTVHEDIANYYSLKTDNLNCFNKLLCYMATTPPGNLNTHNLARNLEIDDKTVRKFLGILADTGLARLLQSDKKGAALIRTPEKILLDNASLYHGLCNELGHTVNQGTLREIFFLNACENAGINVFHAGETGDFRIGENFFEVGGISKNRRQLKNTGKHGFLVKDNILTGGPRTIPLYHFGFLY